MKRRILWVVVVAVQLAAALVAEAQIEVRAKHEGEWLPIVACDSEAAFVLKDGKRKRVGRGEIQVHPASAFGPGTVLIENEQADLDPLRSATAKERSKPGAVSFRYSAEVTGGAPLDGCYAVLVFVASGSVGTHMVPLGSVGPGKKREVKIELTAQVDRVARLHVFSRSGEMRSNRVTDLYSAREYWDELAKTSIGVPAVELCKWADRYPMALSPDGQKLAVVRERDTHFAIVAYDLVSMRVIAEVPVDKEYEKAKDPTWVSDHEVAFVLGGWKLMLLDLEKREVKQLRENVWRIYFSRADKPGILITFGLVLGRTTVAQYDVRARKVVEKDPLSGGWTTFDRLGRGRLRVENDDDVRKHYCRLPGSDRWTPIDSTVKQAGLKFTGRGADFLDEVTDVIGPGADDETVFIADRSGSDTFQIAIYDPVKGVIQQTIAKHPKYDLWTHGDETALLKDPGTDSPVGVIYQGERPRVVWWDPQCAAAQRTLEANFAGQSVLPITWVADHSTFIFYVGSDQDPGAYYVFRPDEAKLIPMFKIAPALAGRKLAQTTPLDFTARDGATIHGYLTLPTGRATGAVPLVVWVHGGPFARDTWGFDATNQFLATRGYAVLQVNYRGSSGYGATYAKGGLQARLDTVVLDDIADGARHLIKAGTVDPRRIAIGGASFGGWATYLSLIKYPELYRAGVAIAAVSNFRRMMQYDRDQTWGDYYSYEVWKTVLGREDFAANERFIDPLLRAAEVRQPVYIMHGERDGVVPATQAREMLKALQKTNPNVESMSFPNAGHTSWAFRDRVTQLNEIEAFLRRHLAPVEAPAATPASALAPKGL